MERWKVDQIQDQLVSGTRYERHVDKVLKIHLLSLTPCFDIRLKLEECYVITVVLLLRQ